jgi:dTDP-4-dehydrorhamnose 3,5-epimerase
MPYQSFDKTEIDGIFKVQPKVFGDERGWYYPELEMQEFKIATGVSLHITQIASSFNAQKGILRGLHYQKPETQGKLVEVVFGSVQDVAVDIRQGSPTFGKVVSAVLTAKDHNQLWVPPGCAHGYLALEDNTRFTYVVTDGLYTPANEKGVNPFDPDLNIRWLIPKDQMNLKDRDQNWLMLKDFKAEDLL